MEMMDAIKIDEQSIQQFNFSTSPPIMLGEDWNPTSDALIKFTTQSRSRFLSDDNDHFYYGRGCTKTHFVIVEKECVCQIASRVETL